MKSITALLGIWPFNPSAYRNHPEQYELYSQRSYTFNNIEQPNRNRLLWRDRSVDGVKTGYTNAAGYCLVASAERNGMRLISVVLGTGRSDEAHARKSKLLSYGFRTLRQKPFTNPMTRCKSSPSTTVLLNHYPWVLMRTWC